MPTRIPIFPLNTVLFPGNPLHLFIFEERYRQMIMDCQEMNLPFGVSLIRRGREALGPLADPYPIGCIAQVIELEKLKDGNMNIMAVGVERFRILELFEKESPYLSGKIQSFPIIRGEKDQLHHEVSHLKGLFETYLNKLAENGKIKELDLDFPSNPVEFSYLVAAILFIPLVQKQELLSISKLDGLISKLIKILTREIALLSAFQGLPPKENQIFSLN
jgi:Lon protease-like protein